MKSHLGEYFVMYSPKNIIGGDFYWTAKVDNVTVAAVVDCTGHGVPDALLTMLGIYALNDIVKDKKLGNKSFKQLLQSTSRQEINEQKSTLEHTFHQWKGKKEQVDDITILGVHLK